MEPPLLRANGARIEADGERLTSTLSFEASGSRVALVGDTLAFSRLLARTARLASGSITILGESAESVTRSNHVGLGLHAPTMPLKWTTNQYLAASARLLGLGWFQARRAANRALERLESSDLAKRRLGMLGHAERQIISVAHATLGDPRVLWLDRPFDGASDADRVRIRRVVDLATTGRRLVLAIGSPAPAGTEFDLLSGMDHVTVITAGEVTASGSPSDVFATSPRYAVRAAHSLEALSSALEERGFRVEPESPGGNATAGRLILHLPEGATPALIVEAALVAEAPIIELVPLGLRVRIPETGTAPPQAST